MPTWWNGRHVRFRCVWSNPWGFKSPRRQKYRLGMCVNSSLINNISFKAGKVHLFSDFDGTYFPVKQLDVEKDIENQKLVDYAKKMDNFFKSTEKDLDFHITTGRHFDSYKAVSELLKSRNIKLTLPKSFITENGWLEYSATDDLDKFYKDGEFPFDKNKFYKRPHYGEKSKAFNPKEILESTKNNSDLIIVAGNQDNDKEMLNPLKYLDLKNYEEKSQNKHFFKQNMNEKLADLKAIYEGSNSSKINNLRNELKNIGLLKAIEELPIQSIIVKNPKKNLTENLQLLLDTFRSTGKIIEIEKGKLDEGIKSTVKKYAESYPKFKEGMSRQFSNIVGINKPFNKNKFLLVGIGVGTFVTGCFYFFNQDKTKTEGSVG